MLYWKKCPLKAQLNYLILRWCVHYVSAAATTNIRKKMEKFYNSRSTCQLLFQTAIIRVVQK